MKVNFIETRIVRQVEYASYEFELPEDIAALSAEERDQWVYDNHDELDLNPVYEYGDVLDVELDDSEIEYFSS
jgi:hypothetical protein